MSSHRAAVILASQRSGTHLLGSLIDHIPGCHYIGEVFLADNDQPISEGSYWWFCQRHGHVEKPTGENIRSHFHRYLDVCLEWAQDANPDVQTAIMDIKYSHLYNLTPHTVDILGKPYLLSILRAERIPIIHLVRNNVLAQYVSRQLAVLPGNTGELDRPHVHRSLRIDCRLLMPALRRLQAETQTVQKWLSGHWPILQMRYEDLLDADGSFSLHTARSASRLLTGEAVDIRAKPSTVKVSPPLPEAVENWQEVCTTLQRTPFAYCCEESSGQQAEANPTP